jgi:kynurenine formamidase
MCDHCCIEAVKQRMLSRRNLFKGAAGVAAATAAATVLPTAPAIAAGHAMSPADLTHELHPDFPTYFGKPGFSMNSVYNFAEHSFNLNEWTVNEHTGTHMDAPLHFSADGQSVAEIPIENLVVPLSVIDIAARAEGDADSQVTPDDIKAWKDANGDLPAGGCVAMHSGWGQHVDSDKFRNADADGKMHFPGFHIEATQMLIEDGNTIGMAVDSLSLDYGLSGDFASHYAWLPTNRWGLENVANLDKLPAAGATLVVGAPKVRGGTGGPCRLMALV